MTTAQIKIVPDARPNDDGEWIDVPVDLVRVKRWKNIEALVKPHIPAGFHLVAVDCRRGPTSRIVTTEPQALLPSK